MEVAVVVVVVAAVAAVAVVAAQAVMAATTMVIQGPVAVTQIFYPTCATLLTTVCTDSSSGARVCHSSRIYR